MKKLLLVSALCLLPALAQAEVKIGDEVGANAEAAKAALAKSGCAVKKFEAEDGKVEALCLTEVGQMLEVVIDPATGKVADIKTGD